MRADNKSQVSFQAWLFVPASTPDKAKRALEPLKKPFAELTQACPHDVFALHVTPEGDSVHRIVMEELPKSRKSTLLTAESSSQTDNLEIFTDKGKAKKRLLRELVECYHGFKMQALAYKEKH